MATMLQAAWRAQSCRTSLASAFTMKRCLSDSSSSGNGRYVAGQGFVAGEGLSHDQWPPPQPPTHGGFVPHSVDGYAQAPVPPTQGGFVAQSVDSYAQIPSTQAGFVDQTRGSVSQEPSYVQADYSAYQYGSYDYGQYGAAYTGFVQAQPYTVQHSQGPYVVDGSAWPPPPPPPLVAPVQYTYPPPPAEVVPGAVYHSGTAAFQSQATAQGSAYPYVQEYASSQQEYASQQTVFQAQESIAGSYASPQLAGDGNAAVESVGEGSQVAAQEAQPEQTEQTTVAAQPAQTEQTNVAMSAAHASNEDGGYDASAAAMAEAGVSSDDHDSHQQAATEEAEEPVKESSPAEAPEAPKPAAPASSQGESFLDILAKANLNIRQNKPRPQLGIRSQRKTYARLHNLPRQILKSDVINYFSEINLQNESVHVTYDEKFYPLYVQIAFDSSEAMRNAQKILQTKGRLGGRVVKMESFVQFAPPSHAQISDAMKDYLGRMLLVLHLPQEGRLEDLERFFDGYGYDPAALNMLDPVNMTLARFSKEGNRLVRRATIGFMSSLEAMRALREKQGDFMLNEPVELRLIQ